MKNALRLTTAIAATLLSAPLTLGGFSVAEASSAHFSFRNLEYLPYDTRMGSAKAFIAEQTWIGMPIHEAIERLKSADAYCPTPPSTGQITCRFGMMVRPSGGTLGEVTWTVNLSQDDHGCLKGISVNRTRSGFGDD